MGEPVRLPKNVLDDLEPVRRFTRVEVPDTPILPYVATETQKPAPVSWIDRHERDYHRGLLDGFQAEDWASAGGTAGPDDREQVTGTRNPAEPVS